MKYKVTIGVFAIITNDKNQVLLVLRNDYNLWNLPGGGLEPNESPWEGVIREVKEETGLKVKISKLLGIYSKPKENDLVFNFECRIISGKLKINQEAKQFKYFNKDQIPPNTAPKQEERISDYFKNPNKFIMKKQTGKTSQELIKQMKL